jgi:sterol desaturase/sphingolipid hydroxylase (fatty acid hydroxylase superfamily)
MALFQSFLIEQQNALRMGAFIGLLILFFALERALPRRQQNVSPLHYLTNLAMGGLNIFILRFALPGGLVGIALLRDGAGLISSLTIPAWASFILCLVLLDLLLYAQHRLLHINPLLWRLHAPHHSDRNLNVASGVRFHPGEAVFSTAIKAAAIWVLGAPVAAVILFEVLLSSASLFNHANWSLGRGDRLIRRLIVTPDMHRLHHSRRAEESRKNFGFFLSVWDRLFASYQDAPREPHEAIALGLEEAPNDGLRAALIQPMKK